MDDLCIIFNELNPDLNFKLETLGDEINFLDVKVKVEDCVITTDIFYKATDSKQYLNFFSHHPHHTKVALPYNLSRRICTIVSSNEIRKGRLEEMKRYLTNCNYPEKLIDDSIKKALTLNRTELIKSVPSNTQDSNLASIVHVSTFHSNYSSNNQVLHSHFNQLKENGTTSEIFSNKKLLLSKRQPPNLKSLLTKAQLQSTVTGGVYSCGNARCQLCNILLTGPSIKFKPTNFHFFIKNHMTCNTFNCIYVIECQGCFKMYIGETNNLRLRVNLHRDHAKKNTGLGVSKHIFSCSIKLNFPFKVMPFYKMSTDDSTIRRRMEEHFINKFKPELNK